MSPASVPASWKTVNLGDVASVSRGASPRPIASPRWFESTSGVGWVRISDLGRSDGLTLMATTQRLSAEGIARSRYLPPGTLILSIAATVGVPIVTGIPTCIHDGFVSIENLKGVHQPYLLYALKAAQSALRKAGQTGSQANVNSDIVKRLPLLLPPEEEQRAIAEALRDADELILSLQRLISKTQAVKQGLMQHLLPRSTRLPGFAGEEHEVYVGEISAPITKGATPTTYGFAWESSGIPFLRSECVSERGLDMRRSMFISPAANHALRRSRIADGDILVTITGYVGRVVRLVNVGEANINQHIARVRIKDSRFASGYVYHYLSQHSMREYYESIVTGQAYPQISLAQVRKTKIPTIPFDEQRAIAAALDDADGEMDLLRHRLAKAQHVKKGMMQALLTGRTRLPVQGEDSE